MIMSLHALGGDLTTEKDGDHPTTGFTRPHPPRHEQPRSPRRAVSFDAGNLIGKGGPLFYRKSGFWEFEPRASAPRRAQGLGKWEHYFRSAPP